MRVNSGTDGLGIEADAGSGMTAIKLRLSTVKTTTSSKLARLLMPVH